MVAPTPESLVGVWVGGFDVPGVVNSPLVEVEITSDGGALSGEVNQYLDPSATRSGPVLAQVTGIAIEGDSVTMTLANNDVEVTLTGALSAGGKLNGTATANGKIGSFELAHAVNLSETSVSAWEGEHISGGAAYGLYAVDQGFSDSAVATFWLVDLNSGQWRLVIPTSEDTALIGPAFGVAFPAEGNLSLVKGSDGAITGLRLDRGGAAAVVPRVTFKTEEVSFPSGDLTLAGRITLPQGNGPHPVVVLTHGSEPGRRGGYRLLTALLAMRGIAAFSYDKRGVGDSEGVYVENASESNIQNLAGDAAAAVAAVKARSDINPKQIGMWGASQAGWVIPVAVTKSPDVAFIIVTSGPVVSTNEEGAWGDFTNDGGTPSPKTLEALDAEIEAVQPSGVDSQDAIRALKIPGLWLFGAADRSIPAQKSARNLARIKQETGGDFSWKVFEGGNHFMLETPDGMNASLPYSNGFTPGYIDAIFAWLLPRVTIAGS